MTEAVNVTMAMLLTAILCGAAVVRLSPPLLRQLADWANARADAEDFMVQRYEAYRWEREKPKDA